MPSGLKWATCNVGATSPEESGAYRIWSATTYDWGNNWRMPTKEELEELVNNCEFSWTEINGVSGAKYTASNGNSIFIPAAEFQYGSFHNVSSGKYAFILSSSIHQEFLRLSHYLLSTENGPVIEGYNRENGYPVRPVRSKKSTSEVSPIDTTSIKIEKDTSTKHEYVDLGLPSGLKWATCNIGANKPEEYGKYFAWGEETAKSYFSKDNCSTVKCRFFGSIVERNGKFTDTAHVNWGGTWKLPSSSDFTELITTCKWNWTSINGVSGMKVVGPNGNWIFIPAAGTYREATCKHLDINGNPYGSYWSLTPINSDYGRADSLGFGLDFTNSKNVRHQIYSSSCYEGHSIRPVSK